MGEASHVDLTVASDEFRRPRLIRFSDCDPAGIVFYPQYFVMLNGLVEDWVNEGLGLSYHGLVAQRRIGLPIPQQRIHPRIVIVQRETCTINREQGRFCGRAHRAAAPCFEGNSRTFGPAYAGKRQRILRARRVGQRRIAIKECNQPTRIDLIGRRTPFGISPQLGFVRKARIVENESRVIVEAEACRSGELLPAIDRLRHWSRLPCDKVSAVAVPFAGFLRGQRGGSSHQLTCGERDYGHAKHAGHSGHRLLIRR
jgi:4-hydroxybenzoyl-CoA thioesterase